MKKVYILLLVVISMVACKKDAEIDTPETITHTMFYNGSVDFFGNSSLMLINNKDSQQLTYNGYDNTPLGAFNYAHYQKMRPGSYLVSFTDSAVKPSKIANAVYKMEAGRYQTVYLTDSAGYYQTLISDDAVERDDDSATIRLLHLCQDAGPVTLYIDTMKIASTENLSYRGISSFVRVKTDTKPGLRIVYSKGGEQVTLTRKSFALLPGRCYTLVLRGAINPPDGNVNKTVNLSGIINQ